MIFAIIFWSAIKRSGNFTNLLNTHRFNSLKNQYLKRNFSSFKACKNFSRLYFHCSGNYSHWSDTRTCRTGPSWSACWYRGRRLTPWPWRCWRWSCWATTELLSRLRLCSPRVLDVGRQAHGASWRIARPSLTSAEWQILARYEHRNMICRPPENTEKRVCLICMTQ